MTLSNQKIKTIEKKIIFHKKRVIDMCFKFGGHISSSFSTAEILSYLYYGKIINSKKNKFLLSKGHGEVFYFSLLADLKYFPEKWLFQRYRSKISKLGGHVSHTVPGIEFSFGSLGHGLSYAAGLCYALKLKKNKFKKIFCLMGDAEINEGSVWEAVIFAGHNKLKNLIAIIDYNKIGSSDFTKNYISKKCLAESWSEYSWNVYRCNGHDLHQLNKTITKVLKSKNQKPTVLILDTIKGKGVSFIENDPIWHVKGLDLKSYKKAKIELNE